MSPYQCVDDIPERLYIVLLWQQHVQQESIEKMGRELSTIGGRTSHGVDAGDF